jgi:very-short-patch-repair endonuclease
MTEVAIQRARELRKGMTDAERRLWQGLRERQTGARFRRQAPIGPYIVDFVAFDQRVVVELDGGQHAEPGQAAHDRARTAFLEAQGFNVLRFWNNDVLGNTQGVLERILEALRAGQGAGLAKCVPSPLVGEGQDGGVDMAQHRRTPT